MSIDTENVRSSLIIINQKTTTVGEVQTRIAELDGNLPEIDTAYAQAAARRTDARKERDELVNALRAAGFPTRPDSAQ